MDITIVSVHKCGIFLVSKAAQGFSLRRTSSTPQAGTRGERCSSKKEPFMNGNYWVAFNISISKA
jgi:hypothetical protein